MKIGIGGSAANPPHIGHRMLLEHLIQSGIFQKIIWLPSGTRKDKDSIASEHRINMTKLAFADLEKTNSKTKLEILFDDTYEKNHPTIWWLKKIQQENPNDEIIWYTGSDVVAPEEKYGGKCEIEAKWEQGEELMKNWKFWIIPRGGFPHPSTLKLPSQFEILDIDNPFCVSSSDIRKRIKEGQPFEHMVVAEVAEYIKKHKLYGWKDKNN